MRNSHIVGEEWRPVEGTNGRYQVSNMGRVIGPQSSKPLRPSKNHYGYLRVYLPTALCKSKKVFVHTLVLETFVGKKGIGQEARHLNGDSGDNRLSNLCWGTRAENISDKWRHGTICIGSKNGNRKIDEQKAIEIVGLLNSGMTGEKVAVLFNIKESCVFAIKHGKTWTHATGIRPKNKSALAAAGKEKA